MKDQGQKRGKAGSLVPEWVILPGSILEGGKKIHLVGASVQVPNLLTVGFLTFYES
jgi:hypothetical protein